MIAWPLQPSAASTHDDPIMVVPPEATSIVGLMAHGRGLNMRLLFNFSSKGKILTYQLVLTI
jgi:hypothetical protein